MSRLRAILPTSQFFKHLLVLLRGFLRTLCRLLKRRPRPCRDPRCGLDLPHAHQRPDPLIYDQRYLMKMGLSVTWDNPDIQLYEPDPGAPDGLGAPVASSDLERDHDYKVRVRVWNGSYDAPAVGLPVYLSYLSFGAGTVSHPVASTQIDLGVKASSQCPAFAVFDWRTPDEKGHYCLQARLVWPDDANPDNNLGQENTNVGVSHSPAEFRFTVRNPASVRRTVEFVSDVYELPEPRPCSERHERKRGQTRLAESRERWDRAIEEQGVGRFPVPDGWAVEFEPSAPTLAAGEEREIAVRVEPAWAAGERQATLNVNAFTVAEDARTHVGGVTLRVVRGDA